MWFDGSAKVEHVVAGTQLYPAWHPEQFVLTVTPPSTWAGLDGGTLWHVPHAAPAEPAVQLGELSVPAYSTAVNLPPWQ